MHSSELPTENDEWRKANTKPHKKPYGIRVLYVRGKGQVWKDLFPNQFSNWYYWYATEKARDQALEILTKRDGAKEFQYHYGCKYFEAVNR